ncbi:hypothetical protein Hanom_Chr04g00313971 [Helianthus anomalus]
MMKLVIAYFIIFNMVFISSLDCTRIGRNERSETGVLNSSSNIGWPICRFYPAHGTGLNYCCCDDEQNCFSNREECVNTCLSLPPNLRCRVKN